MKYFYSKTKWKLFKGKSNIEGLSSEFEYDDSKNQLTKKIKLKNQKIVEKIKEMNDYFDISEHEIHKFLLIFHTLVKQLIFKRDEKKLTNL